MRELSVFDDNSQGRDGSQAKKMLGVEQGRDRDKNRLCGDRTFVVVSRARVSGSAVSRVCAVWGNVVGRAISRSG